MSQAAGTDPRVADAARDIRPDVRMPRQGVPPGVIALAALVAAVLLFAALDARRRTASAPAVAASATPLGTDAPPPLVLPPEPVAEPPRYVPPAQTYDAVPLRRTPVAPALPQTTYPTQVTQNQPVPTPPAAARVASGQALVLDSADTGNAGGAQTGSGAQRTDPYQRDNGVAPRVRASVIANRANTVVQGTIVSAVLETAFDSTRPGFARALVQRDVRGFDGTQVLIPRGSRLIGEYATDNAPGQGRAMIAWSRLIRPDGVSIALGSPVADPVGRGGIKAKVDSHFFARFSGAILQSVLDLGVNLAARRSDTPVVVALPGSVGGTTAQLVRPDRVVPTLSVAQGTSIAVFVARDLDFGGADTMP